MECNTDPWGHSRRIDTADALEGTSKALPLLRQMSPAEILIQRQRAVWLENEGADEIGPTYILEPLEELDEFDDALLQLPKVDLDHARAVYAAFAESPQEDDRGAATAMVWALTRFDREFGLKLWDQLARDPNRNVRLLAYEPLSLCLRVDTQQEAEQRLADLGITFWDASRLLEASMSAERGVNMHHIGKIGT